jgi:hypothetical protein
MDCRVNKKKANPLHTTAGLNQARAAASAVTTDKIQCEFEVRINDGTKRSLKGTDSRFGSWARPWAKDAFLSGTS